MCSNSIRIFEILTYNSDPLYPIQGLMHSQGLSWAGALGPTPNKSIIITNNKMNTNVLKNESLLEQHYNE